MRNRRMKMKNTSLKRRLQVTFAVALSFTVFAVSSVGISADTAQKVYNGITFDEWPYTTYMPTTRGNYYLKDNVSSTNTWSLGGDQNLDLNGKTANIQFTNVNGNTLSIYDSSEGSGVYSSSNGKGSFFNDGTVNIYGGTITGGSSQLLSYGTSANIHGGDIQYSNLGKDSSNSIVVDGGTFASDPSAYLAAGSTMTSVGGKYAVNYTAPATPAAEPQVEADSHVHSYEWVSVKGATDGEDEVMQYRCSCGDVKQEMKVANSAFNNFNQSTANQISKAAAGSTVRVEMGSFTAIHQMIFDAMRQRTDVNVDFIFRNEGHMYSLSVPGGANLSTLPGGAAYTNTESCGCEGIYYVAQQTKTVPAPLN